MATTRIAILLALLSLATAAQEVPSGSNVPPGNQPERGTVCVLPNSFEPPTRISPGGEYNPATLSVRIEKRQPILWPHKKPVRIEHLSLNERHLVVLTSDGKRIQSFWFQFSDYQDVKLCLYLDGYSRHAIRKQAGCSLVQVQVKDRSQENCQKRSDPGSNDHGRPPPAT
jgi:hypothetical protein